jgi:hypothetical protein
LLLIWPRHQSLNKSTGMDAQHFVVAVDTDFVL